MSVESAKAFIELVNGDAGMQTQLGIMSPQNGEQMTRFAASKGYLFEEPHLYEALEAYPQDTYIRPRIVEQADE